MQIVVAFSEKLNLTLREKKKTISLLVEFLNSGLSYLITTVLQYLFFFSFSFMLELTTLNRSSEDQHVWSSASAGAQRPVISHPVYAPNRNR